MQRLRGVSHWLSRRAMQMCSSLSVENYNTLSSFVVMVVVLSSFSFLFAANLSSDCRLKTLKQ